MQLVERFQAARRDPSIVVVEGLHALKHATRFGARPLITVTEQPEQLHELADELAPDLAAKLGHDVELTVVAPGVLGRLVREVPQTGVVALIERPPVTLADALATHVEAGGHARPGWRPIVVLEDPRRMGNVGACVRVAAAAGAAAVITIGPRDPWQADAVRGAAGLHFALPVLAIAGLDELLDAVMDSSHDGASGPQVRAAGGGGRQLVAMDGNPDAGDLEPGGLQGDELLVFGTERSGVSNAVLAAADRRLALPMREGVASLNLATAVAATLYRG